MSTKDLQLLLEWLELEDSNTSLSSYKKKEIGGSRLLKPGLGKWTRIGTEMNTPMMVNGLMLSRSMS